MNPFISSLISFLTRSAVVLHGLHWIIYRIISNVLAVTGPWFSFFSCIHLLRDERIASIVHFSFSCAEMAVALKHALEIIYALLGYFALNCPKKTHSIGNFSGISLICFRLNPFSVFFVQCWPASRPRRLNSRNYAGHPSFWQSNYGWARCQSLSCLWLSRNQVLFQLQEGLLLFQRASSKLTFL